MRADKISIMIQKDIASGRYRPNERIPTRKELEDMFSVSSVTIQKAINSLIEDRFLEARGNLGTFVSSNPPNLKNFILMLPRKLDQDPSKNLFRHSLVAEAESINGRGAAKISVFAGYMDWGNIDKYNRLVADFEEDKLAGVIFAIQPWDFVGTPLLDNPNTARVAISSTQAIPNVPTVFYDVEDFFRKALDYLETEERNTPAYIGGPYDMERVSKLFVPMATEKGMRVCNGNIHGVPLEVVDWGENVAQLLFDRTGADCPDSLIIGDDNLIQPVTRALKKLGMNPENITVVTHSNHPLTQESHFPLLRLGVDSGQMMQACLDCLLQQKSSGGWRSLSAMQNNLPVQVLR